MYHQFNQFDSIFNILTMYDVKKGIKREHDLIRFPIHYSQTNDLS